MEIIKLINDGSLKLFTLNLTYNATPCHIVYDCGKKVGHLRSNNYHIVQAFANWAKPEGVLKGPDKVFCHVRKLAPQKFQLSVKTFGQGIFDP